MARLRRPFHSTVVSSAFRAAEATRRVVASGSRSRHRRRAPRGPARASSLMFAQPLEARLVLSSESVFTPQSDASSHTTTLDSVSPAWFARLAQVSSVGSPSVTSITDRGAAESASFGDGSGQDGASEWIVRLSPTALETVRSVAQAADYLRSTALGVEVLAGLGLPGQLLVQATGAAADVATYLSTHAGVSYAGPNSRIQISSAPNDPLYADLYGLNNVGQTGGTVDADIDAAEAWSLSTGSSSVVVAIIDTGIDYTHPDLAANIWVNPGEIAGDGIDNDLNGFVDDVHGYDFVNNDGDPMDDHFHGTHCAGTIGGVGDNGVGVVGVNWQVSMMGLKFLNAGGGGFTADAIRAVNYATMMRADYGVNVRVTSNSWGGGGFDQGLLDAINAGGTEGILFVAAAGNDDSNNDDFAFYPASYDSPYIVSVAATDHNDTLAYFSNYGATTVDLAAPGVDILSTVPGNGYDLLSGTSMATPHVSGVAALALAVNPSLSVTQLKQALLDNVDPIPALDGLMVTGGRLNAEKVLLSLGLAVTASSPAVGGIVGSPPTVFEVSFSHGFAEASVDAADLEVNGTPADAVTILDPTKLRFTFTASPVTTQGLQQMSIAAGALQRDSDATPSLAFNGSFRFDEVTGQVVAADPADATAVPPPLTTIDLTFNEDIDPASVGIGDLVLSAGSVSAASAVSARVVRFTVTGLDSEQVLSYSLPTGRITDAYGNPIGEYAASLRIDVDETSLSVPFEPVGPLGTLIYAGSAEGSLYDESDEDSFTVVLDAGQTLSVVASAGPEGTIASRITDPDGNVVATAASGSRAVLSAVSVAAAGTWTITLFGGSSGDTSYAVDVTVNTSLESESFGGPSNDATADAESLAPSLLSFGTASRAAVMGTIHASTQVFFEGFETGVLGSQWATYSSLPSGRIEIVDYPTASGDFSLLMDHNDEFYSGDFNLNEAILTVDLSGIAGRAILEFAHGSADDEPEGFTGSFVGHYDADGIAISEDGVTWHPIWDADGDYYTFNQHRIDLSAAATSAGIALGTSFQIKFQQYDNFPFDIDGRIWDDITILDFASDTDSYAVDLANGETVSAYLSGIDTATLKIRNAAGVVVAQGPSALAGYTAPTAGTYYVSVTADTGLVEMPYTLLVTLDAAFDMGGNDTPQTAQAMGGSVANGYAAFGHVTSEAPPATPDITTLSSQSSSAVSPVWFASLPLVAAAGVDAAATSEWIVRLSPTALETVRSVAQAADYLRSTALGVEVLAGLGLPGQLLVQATGAAADVATYLSTHAGVSYAGPNSRIQISSAPNDPLYADLYGLNNVGQTGGTVDADIDAAEAWSLSTGSSSVVVAIIDTGIDYTHPDLAANIWVNPGEIAGDGIDNDLNGFVDDVHGYDFVNNDGDPMDDHFHGTHCAGTIGGVGDNGVGVVGVNWQVSMMGLKFLNADGGGFTANAIRAVNYATMMRADYGVNVRVTSNSWGGGGFDQGLLDAIDAGGAEGILFVAAAGNDSSDNDDWAQYPASYDSPYIVSVAATDHNDALADFSNYGATTVDLAAPGVDILSTMPGNGYGLLSGTSMATPHVSGVAALAVAVTPSLSVTQLKQALLDNVDPVPALDGLMVTGGRLNANKVLRDAIPDTDDFYSLTVGAGYTLTVGTLTPGDGDGEFVNLLDPQVSLYGPNGALIASDDSGAADGRNALLTHTTTVSGVYRIRVTAAEGQGEYVLQVDAEKSAPTIAIEVDKSALAIGQTATATFILSAPSTNFVANDVSVTNGWLEDWKSSAGGSRYTATIVPKSNTEGTLEISVAAERFTDFYGNGNEASGIVSVALDTKAPTVSIATNKSMLKANETATITFSLSEPVASLTSDRVAVTGGTLGEITGSGLVRTATFTPAADTDSGVATISIAAGAIADDLGNVTLATAVAPSITFDTTQPTVSIAADKTLLRFGETARLTFTMSESVNLTAADFDVVGGTLGPILGTGLTRVATFTPVAAASGSVSISLAAAKISDAFGNTNPASSLSPTISYNTIIPTVKITTSAIGTPPRVGSPGTTITFELNDASMNFDVSDVVLRGGTLSAFATTDNKFFTSKFTPTARFSGSATISVAANVFDNGFNPNVAATPLTLSVDQQAPSVRIATDKRALKAGETATITFTLSEAIAGFSKASVTVTNGTLGDISESGLVRTATFTPTGGVTGQSQISIEAGAIADDFGNPNIRAALAPPLSIDTQIPVTLGVTLTADTGISATDNITKTGTLKITNVEPGARVQYSIDDGSTWTTSFRAAAGSNSVIARQLDRAGNPSNNSAKLSFTLLTGSATVVGEPTVPTEKRYTTGENLDYSFTFDRTVVYVGPNDPASVPFLSLDRFNRINGATKRSARFFAVQAGVTGDAAADVISAVGHGFVDGDVVQFSGLSGGDGLADGTSYFVKKLNANTLSLSRTRDGDTLDFTTDITAGSLRKVGGLGAAFRYLVDAADVVTVGVLPATSITVPRGGSLVDLAGNPVRLSYAMPVRLPRATVNN